LDAKTNLKSKLKNNT